MHECWFDLDAGTLSKRLHKLSDPHSKIDLFLPFSFSPGVERSRNRIVIGKRPTLIAPEQVMNLRSLS